MTIYDVVVVGAGPIGCYTAYQLADKGFDVMLLEKDKEVGNDVLCAGVIGKEVFQRYNIPSDSILTKLNKLILMSPSGIHLEYIHSGDLAYVVDRDKFDKGILQLALERGAKLTLDQNITEINQQGSDRSIVALKSDSNIYRARIVVIATGVNYNLQHTLGMGKVDRFLIGAQTKINTDRLYRDSSCSNSAVEIHTGQSFAPGSFAWVVPANDRVRVGVLTEGNAKGYLIRFIQKKFGFDISQNNDIREKPVAFAPLRKSVKGRLLAVGEAAGQVKTTTGGGIFYGLVCSEIASKLIEKTLHSNNIRYLEKYERKWRRKFDNEISIGKRVREVAKKVDDETLDRLFYKVKESHYIINGIIRKINFEYHGELLRFLLRVLSRLLISKNM